MALFLRALQSHLDHFIDITKHAMPWKRKPMLLRV